MQLINILRDVLEDSKRGRIYLPLDDLIRFGITRKTCWGENLVKHPGWEPFCNYYTQRAKTYGRAAKSLLGRLDREMRYSPAAMMAFYDSILRKIAKTKVTFSQRGFNYPSLKKLVSQHGFTSAIVSFQCD